MGDVFERVILHEIQENGAGDEDADDGEDKNKEGHQHLHGGLQGQRFAPPIARQAHILGEDIEGFRDGGPHFIRLDQGAGEGGQIRQFILDRQVFDGVAPCLPDVDFLQNRIKLVDHDRRGRFFHDPF